MKGLQREPFGVLWREVVFGLPSLLELDYFPGRKTLALGRGKRGQDKILRKKI